MFNYPLVIAFALSCSPSSACAQPPEQSSSPDLAKAASQVRDLTNDLRRQQGRPELKENKELSKAAQEFAEFMARTDKYSHTADGKEPWDRASAQGYRYCIILENIAYQFSSAGFTTRDLAAGFIQSWEKSPEHRKNMLDPDIDHIGIGIAHSAQSNKYYAVQDFGRPKSKEIVFKIANETDSALKYTLDGKDFAIEPRYTMTHEVCRPPEVKFSWRGAETLRPRNGSKYVVRKSDGEKYSVEKD